MNNQHINQDSQAVLLLCGHFGKSSEKSFTKPLSTKEYNILVSWLLENQMRPKDLLTADGLKRLQKISGIKLDTNRITALLKRGGALALATEKWLNKGLWIVSRSDQQYPDILLAKLKQAAPPLLFGAGNAELLRKGGLAIVGSRNFDKEAKEFTSAVAQTAASCGMQIVSGGARGVDQEAMLTALKEGGTVIGVLSDRLQRAAVAGKYRQSLQDKNLVLISPYNPEAGFNVGNAMGRNKYIYALAEYGLVVSSSYNSGGTWAGATEELKRDRRIPVFVRMSGNIPKGNKYLIKRGAIPFPERPWKVPLSEILSSAAGKRAQPEQLELGVDTLDYAKVSEKKSKYTF